MKFPVSVKGILRERDAVLFLRNERDELELPGGRLEPGETIEHAVAREILEETGIIAEAVAVTHAGVFEVIPDKHVLVIICRCVHQPSPISLSNEHIGHEWLQVADLERPDLPGFYRRALDRE